MSEREQTPAAGASRTDVERDQTIPTMPPVRTDGGPRDAPTPPPPPSAHAPPAVPLHSTRP